nr:hypothetical protein CcurKRNrm2_p117 [Cryptomonas curvata]
MNKQIFKNKSLEKILKKIVESILFNSGIRFSNKCVKFLIEICFNIIKTITIRIVNLYQKNSRRNLSEEDVLLIFKELRLNRYILEVLEEKNRIQSENQKLENIIV